MDALLPLAVLFFVSRMRGGARFQVEAGKRYRFIGQVTSNQPREFTLREIAAFGQRLEDVAVREDPPGTIMVSWIERARQSGPVSTTIRVTRGGPEVISLEVIAVREV